METIEGHSELPVRLRVLPTHQVSMTLPPRLDIIVSYQVLLGVSMWNDGNVDPNPSSCSVICRAWFPEIAEN